MPNSRPLSTLLRANGIAFSALATLIFAAFGSVFDSDGFRPFLKFSVEESINGSPTKVTTVLIIDSMPSQEACEAMLKNVLRSAVGACQQCTVAENRCLEDLQPELETLLGDRPVGIYSARLPSGTAYFESSNLEAAKFACEETQRRASGIGTIVQCSPPNSPRPLSAKAQQFGRAWDTADVWNVMAWIAFAVFVMQIGRVSIPRLGVLAIDLPRWTKQGVILLADIVTLEFSLWAAFSIRLETIFVPALGQWPVFLLSPLIAVPIFIRFGLYRAVMRYLGLRALGAIAKAVLLYASLFTLAVFLLSLPGVPRSVPLIHGALAMLLTGGSRALARHWLLISQAGGRDIGERKRVAIFGAGAAGVQLAAALAHSREMIPILLIDDDPVLRNKQIAGLNVIGLDDLEEAIERDGIVEVLLAIPSASRARRNQIIGQLEPLPVHVRTLPGLAALAEGKVSVSHLREIDIEDVLGRDPVAPDRNLLAANVSGKSVMVTGAGGSIGAELCRQILDLDPRCLILFDIGEFSLYSIERELIKLKATRAKSVDLSAILGSVCDGEKMKRVVSHFGVQTIYHAAAYKHVPMVEKNPCEGARNNALGTWIAANAAIETGVETFVLISTDKAVRPTNTMGTTKRLAEMILQSLSAEYPQLTKFTMVRFGNVLGSSGSVVPLFREQIRHGGPITVTDPRIIRYFMTIPEAAQLVIQAGALGSGGDVFVLDMGDPIKIFDLARRMVHLSGSTIRDEETPDGDIEIQFTGLRPGEKLYEELLIGSNVSPTSHPRISRANEATLPLNEIRSLLCEIESACAQTDSRRLREILLGAVKEFRPQCGNEDPLSIGT